MKTNFLTPIATMITVLSMAALTTHIANAQASGEGQLISNDRAYIYPIQGAPNPAPDVVVPNATITYVSLANGPAIYSYPTSGEIQEVNFNVQYIDTANGPAIYSYPRNTGKFSLKLSSHDNDEQTKLSGFITPASITKNQNVIDASEENY